MTETQEKTYETAPDSHTDSNDVSFVQTVIGCWPLLFGIGIVMVGHGLQWPLLGLRATMEGFEPVVTGLIMSGYAGGFIAGSKVTPTLLQRVGHVRVFAALASIVSVSALLHIIYISPGAWILMRLATGFCFAGLYIVAESWLNDRINNQTRGQLLAVYMVIQLGGMGSGPLLLNTSNPGSFELFILVSILFSFALVPILLTVGPTPAFDAPERIKLHELGKKAPLGVIGCFATGVSNGAIVGIGAVYAEKVGLSVAEISLFMGIALWGGVAFQWPIGILSDKFDRRLVLTAVTFIAAVIALIPLIFRTLPTPGLLILFGIFGGLTFPMYSLSLAYTNDHLLPEQMVAASSGLVMVTGLGAFFAPMISGAALSFLGTSGFPGYLVIVHLVFGLYAIYRMRKVPGIPIEEQGPPVYLPRTSSVAAAVAFEEEPEKTSKND